LLITLVIGGIAKGWFSPTEAASIGGVGAFLLCAYRRKLTLEAITTAIQETLRTTGMIYVVIIGAIVFSTFIAAAGIASNVADFISSLNASPLAVVAIMVLIILALGMFLDGLAMMTLTIPIFLPITDSLGLNPIWFGIVLVRAMEIGFVTPPVGMNVYIIHALAKDVPLMTIFKGIVPFLMADLVHLVILVLVPATALFLPKVLGT
jgi:tripartite ATP-independent transporter DctM subunit